MDKETLGAAVLLDVEISRIENYLNEGHIQVNFIKSPNGVDYMDFYNGRNQCFSSEEEDAESVARIKEMVVGYLNKKLNQYKKEFEEL